MNSSNNSAGGGSSRSSSSNDPEAAAPPQHQVEAPAAPIPSSEGKTDEGRTLPSQAATSSALALHSILARIQRENSEGAASASNPHSSAVPNSALPNSAFPNSALLSANSTLGTNRTLPDGTVLQNVASGVSLQPGMYGLSSNALPSGNPGGIAAGQPSTALSALAGFGLDTLPALAGTGTGLAAYPALANLNASAPNPSTYTNHLSAYGTQGTPLRATAGAVPMLGTSHGLSNGATPDYRLLAQRYSTPAAPAPTPVLSTENLFMLRQLAALADAGRPGASNELALLLGRNSLKGTTLNPAAAYSSANTTEALEVAKRHRVFAEPMFVPTDIAAKAAAGAFVSLAEVKGFLDANASTKKSKAIPVNDDDDISRLINQVGTWRSEGVTSSLGTACGFAVARSFLAYGQKLAELKASVGTVAAVEFDARARRHCLLNNKPPSEYPEDIYGQALGHGLRDVVNRLTSYNNGSSKRAFGSSSGNNRNNHRYNGGGHNGGGHNGGGYNGGGNGRFNKKRSYGQGPGARPHDADGNEVCLNFTHS